MKRALVFAVFAVVTAGCAPMIPVVVASSYVAAQTAAAYMPDSLEKQTKN